MMMIMCDDQDCGDNRSDKKIIIVIKKYNYEISDDHYLYVMNNLFREKISFLIEFK